MNDHGTEDSDSSVFGSSPSGEGLLWRPWPCASCRQGVEPSSDLIGSKNPDPKLLPSIREEITRQQATALVGWSEICSHSSWQPFGETKITQGSEHAVYFNEGKSQVTKITLPDTYGDFYFLKNGIVHQEKNTPVEYLVRLHLWKKLFRIAPYTVGVTKQGRIISRQPFIAGDPPTQEEVDAFLVEAGLTPVKTNRFLWKSRLYLDAEIWIGDTRDENFVKTESGIVPIDVRLWFV